MTAYATAAVDSKALDAATEPDNRMVWDQKRAGHYEVWYLTCNQVAARLLLVGYHLRVRKRRHIQRG